MQAIICRSRDELSANEKEVEKDNYWMVLKMVVFVLSSSASGFTDR